jgi:hypothetical protein
MLKTIREKLKYVGKSREYDNYEGKSSLLIFYLPNPLVLIINPLLLMLVLVIVCQTAPLVTISNI